MGTILQGPVSCIDLHAQPRNMVLSKCYTCKASLDRSGRRRSSRLNAHFKTFNKPLGSILKDSGWKTGRKESWGKKICCAECIKILARWCTSEKKWCESNQAWLARTNQSFPNKRERRIGPKFKTQAVSFVRSSKYQDAYRTLIQGSKSAKNAWHQLMKRMVRKEMIALLKEKDLFPERVTNGEDVCSSFQWDFVLERIRAVAPTLLAATEASIIKKDDGSVQSPFTIKCLGTMVTLPLYHRKPRSHKFLLSSRSCIRGNAVKVREEVNS